ncbi:MAG: ABC transporter permease [Tepidisphaeraceae bacterium]
MSDWHLLRVMLLKEIRTTLRERSQVLRMVMSVIVLVLVMGNTMYQMSHLSRRFRAMPHTSAPVHQVEEPAILNWAPILGATGGGFFFSTGYLIAAILACFVGEKENRTLEILLASPLSDLKIFLLKAASVLIPSALLGAAMGAVGTLAVSVMLPPSAQSLPQMFVTGLLLGLPALILLQTCIVGLGAAISVKAETMKGAGQTLGVVMTVMIFGLAYGLPMLLRSTPGLQQPLSDAVGQFMTLSFSAQYGLLLAALAIAAIILLGIGRMLFRRDRMLT